MVAGEAGRSMEMASEPHSMRRSPRWQAWKGWMGEGSSLLCFTGTMMTKSSTKPKRGGDRGPRPFPHPTSLSEMSSMGSGVMLGPKGVELLPLIAGLPMLWLGAATLHSWLARQAAPRNMLLLRVGERGRAGRARGSSCQPSRLCRKAGAVEGIGTR